MINLLSSCKLVGFLAFNSLFVGLAKCAVDWNQNNSAIACDFSGNDLYNVQLASSKCAQRCYRTRQCTHFTWTQYQNGTCWMKKGPVSRNDAFSTTDDTMICGIIDVREPSSSAPPDALTTDIHWNENNSAIACDFDNQDLYHFRTASGLCADLCSNIVGCTHYSWTSYQNGTCWMKNGPATRYDAYANTDETMICGIINSTKRVSVDQRITTAYWDCCKPTCKWFNETNNTRSSKICNQDDGTVLSNNTIFGYNNGSAYTCSNRIPWSISPNVSYGFAAATIADQFESDWCYSCYSLVFTSGPVVGKQLIVMVTNTDSDVGQNRFNLQIPGSGWNLFDGCASHFPNSTSLGVQYGHVSQRSECANLPAAVQAGCYWRFDWFQNADSPDVRFKQAFACDFNGNDLSNVQIRGEDCGGRCAQTAGCTHFTWTKFNGGTCWMKKGSISKSDAVFTNDNSMTCGVMDPGSSSSGVAGSTTRYWDCCKPSCGWPGKVSGSNAYVKSCNKGGSYAYNNPDVKNICINGGDAYTCNNQKPWAVDDSLAYGFTAAHIPGLSEQDRCCKCYKLYFTSGPVQGKTMIVQVTNSGTDVGAHQFDLQIPGGGVGIYNGCSPQWNAPDNGWGAKYGGVGSRQECNVLPQEIRDGCFFRFDWFKGADNPTMNYAEVQCPAAMVAITGCSR